MAPADQIIWPVIIAVCLIGGALLVLNSAVRMFLVRDAYERLSAMTPATGFGLPLIVIGAGVELTWQHGFHWAVWARIVVVVTAAVLVSSVGSNVLGRAAYLSGAPLDPATRFNDLAAEPDWPDTPPAGTDPPDAGRDR